MFFLLAGAAPRAQDNLVNDPSGNFVSVTSAYSVLPYTLWECGNGSGVCPSGGGVCYIFLAGNRPMHLFNPRFFGGREIVREIVLPFVFAFKNVFTFWKLVFNDFIAEGFCDRNAFKLFRKNVVKAKHSGLNSYRFFWNLI